MQDYMTLGPTPHEEDCQQVPYTNRGLAMAECRAFANQILRVAGQPPQGAFLKTKAFPHDFGTYLEVAVIFDDQDQKAVDWAIKVENLSIPNWDTEAKRELVDYMLDA